MEREFTQMKLASFLGIWNYTHRGIVKFWRVLPEGDTFVIRWGDTLAELDALNSPCKIIINDSDECYKRILSKARGGYVLEQPFGELGGGFWTPKCHDEFDSIEEVLVEEQSESRKRKPRKRKLSLLDWMGGLDENRENEKD